MQVSQSGTGADGRCKNLVGTNCLQESSSPKVLIREKFPKQRNKKGKSTIIVKNGYLEYITENDVSTAQRK